MPDAPAASLVGGVLVALIAAFEAIAGVALWVHRRLGGRALFAREPRRDVPWGEGSTVGALAIAFGMVNASGFLHARVSGVGRPGAAIPEIPWRGLLLVNALTTLAAALLIVVLLRITSRARPADFGLIRRRLGRDALGGLVACAAALPGIYAVQWAAIQVWRPDSHPVERAIVADRSGMTALIAALSAVVVAPVCEELLFRGVLLGGLRKVARPSRSPEEIDREGSLVEVWGPNLLVSALFAVLHGAQWPAPLPLFFLSLGLEKLYRRSGSIAGPIVMHALFNGLSTAALLVAAWGPFSKT